MINRTRFIVPLAALVVVALALVAWLVYPDGRHSPAVLRLAATHDAVARAEAAPAAAGQTSSGGGTGAYRLTGELPEGQPADGAVFNITGTTHRDQLIAALGRPGFSTDHGAWWWSPGCAASEPVGAPPAAVDPSPANASPGDPGKPADQPAPPTKPAPNEPSQVAPPEGTDGGGTACVASGSGSSGTVSSGTVSPEGGKTSEPAPAEPTAPAMTEEQARQAAARVFDAVDLRVADAHVNVTPYGASVWLDPQVEGLPTDGYTTRVELDQKRQIASASGFLGTTERGDNYPLITAQQAFKLLPAQPRMMMMCPVGPAGQGCVTPPDPEVTGGRLGLAMRQQSEGSRVLVPAWLFAVKGSDQPVAQLAVTAQFLGDGPNSGGADDTTKTDPGPPASEPAGGGTSAP